jgi:hypothetical protein
MSPNNILYNDILAHLWQKVKYRQDWKIGLTWPLNRCLCDYLGDRGRKAPGRHQLPERNGMTVNRLYQERVLASPESSCA